mgnify:CR=1 FL=1
MFKVKFICMYIYFLKNALSAITIIKAQSFYQDY